ncbi:MAG: hypothetical protein ACREIC_33745, partial [Limisphaerales bacterium]
MNLPIATLKTNCADCKPSCRQMQGNALLLVLILLAVSLVMVAGIFSYSASNSHLNQRDADYYQAVAASEAATEKVLSQITSDFRNYGDGYVQGHLATYRQAVPSSQEYSLWTNFDFMDLSGQTGQLEVDYYQLPGFNPVSGQYGPLNAFQDRIRILANARSKTSLDGVVGAVYQDIQLTRIPIFQYAIFYNVALEFTPLPPMNVYGPVHCNTNIYMNPAGSLTFFNDVTSSGTIIMGPNPTSPLGTLGGSVTFKGAHDSGVSTLNLPIGTNNSPAAVVQVLDMPPPLENPQSSLGEQRYYNKADLIVLVTNNLVKVGSGLWNNFSTILSSNEVFSFVSTNAPFYSKREAKTILPIQIDISKLVLWNVTNTSIRPTLPLHDVRVIYVADLRTFASTNESGVRLVNGSILPPQGLTIATPAPLYIQGNYNAPAAALGTTNTSATLPASLAADAITVLSTAWNDANSARSLSSRPAANTTVNAAFLTGIVATTGTSD